MSDAKQVSGESKSSGTARERVVAALAHRQPKRVPFSWGFGPTAEMQVILREQLTRQGLDWDRLADATEDKVGVGPTYTGDPKSPGWGIKTRPVSYEGGSYQEFTDFPLGNVTDVAQLRDYPWPDPKPFDFAGLPQKIQAANPGQRRAVQIGGGNPFEIYCWMTGLEQSLTNMVAAPEIVTTALDYITTHMETVLTQSLRAAGPLVDLVFLADDLGTQHGLMISRQMYRDLLQPFHKRLARCVKTYAPQATCAFHSDGSVFDLLPDLMDAGVEMLEAVQTDAAGMDPQRLKDTYGKRLGFHGGISVQQLLPHSDAQTVDRECRRLVAIFGRDGGYIAAPAHAIQVGTPVPNVLAMLRAVLGEEDYAKALAAAAL
jgi:uroporphyrinogen decarboxylase